MKTISLKDYFTAKGLKLKWISQQIGFPYVSLSLALKHDYSFPEDVASRLEVLTMKDWIAVPTGRKGRFKMKISLK